MPAFIFPTRVEDARRHRLALTMRVALDGGEGVTSQWNQIAYEGEWQGHPAGEFEFTREVFETLVQNFLRRADPIPLTYGHPHPDQGAYVGAAGWITDLRIDEDHEGRVALFGLMEFTDRAAEKVRSGELRHCSVVVAFDSYDERSGDDIGPELLEVGLVLSAFLDGMQPLRLSRSAERPSNPRRRAASRGTARKVPLMDPAAISAKLNQLAELLAISPDDLDSDDLYSTVFDRIRALLDAGSIAEMLGGGDGSADAAAASRALSALRGRVACAIDVDALKSALDELDGDPSPEQVRGVIDEALAAQESADEGEKPTKAGDEGDAQLAAADMPNETPEGAAEAQMAEEALNALAEATGMDMAELLAAMEERQDELASLLQGQAPEGTSADEAAMMSRARVEALETKLGAAEARAERAEAAILTREKRIAELERGLTAQRVDLAIERGHLIEGRPYDRDKLVDLAHRSPEHFAALMDDGERVPTGSSYAPERPSENRAAKPTDSAEAVQVALAKVKAEEPGIGKRELRAKAYARAKAEFPEAFGISR